MRTLRVHDVHSDAWGVVGWSIRKRRLLFANVVALGETATTDCVVARRVSETAFVETNFEMAETTPDADVEFAAIWVAQYWPLSALEQTACRKGVIA